MAVLDERRGGDELGRGGDVGTNKEAVYNDLIEMADEFDALSDGERLETLLGLPRYCRECLRANMVGEAALGNV